MDPPLSVEELVRELDEPNLTNWKLFSRSPGLDVYRRPRGKIFEYKCYNNIPDVLPETFYKVALDIEYRLVWDKYLKEAREISDGEKQGIYWQVIMPLFVDNRDYTFVREYGEYDIDNRHFYYAMTLSDIFQNEPPRKKIVRIETCQSQALVTSDGANGLRSLFLYYEDPRGNLPNAFWNWAAKFGIPIYSKLTLNACKTYAEWLKDKKTVVSADIGDEIDSAAATAAAAAITMPTTNSADDGTEDEPEPPSAT